MVTKEIPSFPPISNDESNTPKLGEYFFDVDESKGAKQPDYSILKNPNKKGIIEIKTGGNIKSCLSKMISRYLTMKQVENRVKSCLP